MELSKFRDGHDRIFLFATAQLALNTAYAVYHGVLGFLYASLWFFSLSAYYLILSAMRFASVLSARKDRANGGKQSERSVMRFTGALLVLLSFVLFGSVYYCSVYEVAKPNGTIVMITIAAYTFYKLTAAIVNAVKARKHGSLLLLTLRSIACADAAVSILSLQRSMLVSFAGKTSAEIRTMNWITGLCVCLLIFISGLEMIFRRKAHKTHRLKIKKEGIPLATSKLVKANEKIAQGLTSGFKKVQDGVVDGYKSIESAVVSGYTKIEDGFVERYLTRDGETVEKAKERLKSNRKDK